MAILKTSWGTKRKTPTKKVEEKKETAQKDNSNMLICPQCNEKKLVMQENCMKCLSCGYGKCS